jgi:hypothetical protein
MMEQFSSAHLTYLDGFDKEYAGFSARCIFYRDEFLEKELDALVTPRRLDMSLLDYGKFFL